MTDDRSTSVFNADASIYGKKITSVPKPERNVGIDTAGTFYDNLIKCVKIADISHFLFQSSNFYIKKLILKLINSNFFIDNKKPVISIRYPFENMLQRGDRQIWGG